ncbi:hypothetical protein O973_24675 [Mycobacterium avium subsp. avium 11-4751]|nr:hypothetical protein O973_24675 [Mycobacterium avium subsp. avium 11-4751]
MRFAGSALPTCARSWPRAGTHNPPAGDALVLDLPTVETRSLEAYKINTTDGTA